MCIVQRYNADTKETRPSSAVFTAFLSTAEHFMMTGIDYISDAVLKRVSEHEIFSKPLSTQVGASETRGILNSFSRVMETEDVITVNFTELSLSYFLVRHCFLLRVLTLISLSSPLPVIRNCTTKWLPRPVQLSRVKVSNAFTGKVLMRDSH